MNAVQRAIIIGIILSLAATAWLRAQDQEVTDITVKQIL